MKDEQAVRRVGIAVGIAHHENSVVGNAHPTRLASAATPFAPTGQIACHSRRSLRSAHIAHMSWPRPIDEGGRMEDEHLLSSVTQGAVRSKSRGRRARKLLTSTTNREGE